MSLRARQFGVLMLTLSLGCSTVRPSWSLPQTWLRRNVETPAEDLEEQTAHPSSEEEREPLIASADDTKTSENLQLDPVTQALIDAELERSATLSEQREIALQDAGKSTGRSFPLDSHQLADASPDEGLFVEGTADSMPHTDIQPAAHSIFTGNAAPDAADNQSLVTANATTSEAVPQGTVSTTAAETLTTATTGLQKKIKSLTDPNWMWPSSGSGSESTDDKLEKSERGPFGLPHLRNSWNSPPTTSEPATSQAPHSLAPTDVQPQRAAAIESRMTPGAALWEDEMLKLISLLEAEASTDAEDLSGLDRKELRKQIALRMLYLVSNDPQQALQVIPGLPPAEQEFWTALFQGLSQYLDQSGYYDPSERATQAIAQLRTAAYHLQQSAKLRLRNVTICQQINGFGSYETFSSDTFAPGQTILIYAEIRNFHSQPSSDGYYVTRIRSTIEIYSADDHQLLDRATYDPTEDRSRTLRTDYYHSYRLDLPAHLPSGRHFIKLILEDEQTGKQATESVYFTIR